MGGYPAQQQPSHVVVERQQEKSGLGTGGAIAIGGWLVFLDQWRNLLKNFPFFLAGAGLLGGVLLGGAMAGDEDDGGDDY